jgi:tight adherence protein C
MNEYVYPLIAAGLGFVSVLLGVYGVFGFLSGAGNVERIRDRVHGGRADNGSALGHALRDAGRSLARMFDKLGSRVAPKEEERENASRLKLVQAGLRKPESYRVFQGAKAGMALIMLALFMGARTFLFDDMSMGATMFAGAGALAAGMYAPDLWLSSRLKKRQTSVTNALPDALDLLVVCVESGMGLDQAITRVCEEMRLSGPEISEDFYLLTLELRAGKKRADALRALSRRVGLDDLNSLVTLLIQADIFGISVGRTLRVYSDSMRKRRQQKAEEAAAKLPVKLMLPLILFILPALFATIMGPAIIMLGDVFEVLPN